MRLYLRAQLEQRARDVWGSDAALELERAARVERRERAERTAAGRRLRALRMDVRSSLFASARAPHEHEFGPEAYDAQADVYRRECACGHAETYEKM
ncbi:DNA repair protein complementing XP-A cells homolog [Pararge aegeria]|uniref:DNA repair protein complementing XP-A cells homolog n=1 Tax=Pararge aegeria TaxID=116150 RepID=UPI0019D11BBC|nr:DNA repair protein complementing XP-A cells homolog [Pararge aegeria]